MADTSSAAKKAANDVPQGGDHDRVQMLSLRADGSPDQHNPEIVGDKDVAVAAAKRQFAEQAVSAVDVAERGVTAGGADEVPQDPAIEKLKKAHESAAAAAEKRAESVVSSLHQG